MGALVGSATAHYEEGEALKITNCHVKNATIAGLGATEDGSYGVGGLVGTVGHTELRNCSFNGNVTGSNCVGGLIGEATNGGSIIDSHATANVQGYDSSVGGLAGDLYDATVSIIGSSFKGTIQVDEGVEPSYWGYEHIGGLAGNLFNGTDSGKLGIIKDSMVSAVITVNAYEIVSIGGISGYLELMDVSNCIIDVTIVTPNAFPSLDVQDAISPEVYTSEIRNVFFVDSAYSNGKGVLITKDDLSSKSIFKGFDFRNAWRMYDGKVTLQSSLPPIKSIASDTFVKIAGKWMKVASE